MRMYASVCTPAYVYVYVCVQTVGPRTPPVAQRTRPAAPLAGRSGLSAEPAAARPLGERAAGAAGLALLAAEPARAPAGRERAAQSAARLLPPARESAGAPARRESLRGSAARHLCSRCGARGEQLPAEGGGDRGYVPVYSSQDAYCA